MPCMQAIISYPRLTDDTRNKSWETFFNKLIEDMKSDMKKGGRKRRIKVSRSAKEYLFSDEEAKAVKASPNDGELKETYSKMKAGEKTWAE